MYTGTLIRDLLATVEQAELGAQQKQMAEERELQRLYQLQIPVWQQDSRFVGAA